MELKSFQRTALDTLASFLEGARTLANPEQAFIESWRSRDSPQTPPPYRTMPGLPGGSQCLPAAADWWGQDAACCAYCCHRRAALPGTRVPRGALDGADQHHPCADGRSA